jgi:hypothetical protein
VAQVMLNGPGVLAVIRQLVSCAWRIRKSSQKRIGLSGLVRYRHGVTVNRMMHLLILAVHLLATVAKLMRPGGVRAVVAESLLLKQHLLISGRARRRAPNLNYNCRGLFQMPIAA